jgi:hypothetical protein
MENTEIEKRGPHPPWKPGQSGNPAGRKPIPPELMERMKNLCPVVIDTMEAIVRGAGKAPERIKAGEFLWTYVYGRPPQEINLGGQSDNPIIVTRPLAGLTDAQIAVLEGIMQNVNPTGLPSVGEESILD